MKSWLIFGSGLTSGVILGVLFTAFILFDDLTKKSSTTRSTVATAKSKPKKAAILSSLPSPEAKPDAIAAEAVDLDSLPPAEENGVMATAKREDAATLQGAH